MTWRVAGAARATTGARASQEDAFGLWPRNAEARQRMGEGLLAVVTDGMGGHAGGEIAGPLACDTFLAAFAELWTQGAAEPGRCLEAALDASNDTVPAKIRPAAMRMACFPADRVPGGGLAATGPLSPPTHRTLVAVAAPRQ